MTRPRGQSLLFLGQDGLRDVGIQDVVHGVNGLLVLVHLVMQVMAGGHARVSMRPISLPLFTF